MELTSKQRAQLRGLANSIDTIVHIGKDGISENLVKQADDALEARELIKGRVLENNIEYDARLAAEESIYCNVISASTQQLSREVYGSMLLGIPSGQFDRAVDFIKAYPNIQVEEVEHDVQ